MADRERADAALADRLRELRSDLAFPPTPPVVSGVLERIRSPRVRRPAVPARWGRRRVLALVAAGLLLALAVAFGARLVLGAAEIRVQPNLTPDGPPLGPDGLGAPAVLDEVAAAVGFELGLPAGAPPDRAYAVRTADGRTAALLAWSSGPGRRAVPGTPWGLVLLQTRSDAETITKTVARFDDVREVTAGLHPAFWLQVPHELLVHTEAGTERFWVRGNVLIWTEGDVTFRLETSRGLRYALALAESVG